VEQPPDGADAGAVGQSNKGFGHQSTPSDKNKETCKKKKIKTPRLHIKTEFRSFAGLSILVTRVNDPSKVR
jgi:hypothetical protein